MAGGGLTFTLIIIKIGRAPGFIQHRLAQVVRPKSYHPGKRRLAPFLLNLEVYQGDVKRLSIRSSRSVPQNLGRFRATCAASARPAVKPTFWSEAANPTKHFSVSDYPSNGKGGASATLERVEPDDQLRLFTSEPAPFPERQYR